MEDGLLSRACALPRNNRVRALCRAHQNYSSRPARLSNVRYEYAGRGRARARARAGGEHDTIYGCFPARPLGHAGQLEPGIAASILLAARARTPRPSFPFLGRCTRAPSPPAVLPSCVYFSLSASTTRKSTRKSHGGVGVGCRMKGVSGCVEERGMGAAARLPRACGDARQKKGAREGHLRAVRARARGLQGSHACSVKPPPAQQQVGVAGGRERPSSSRNATTLHTALRTRASPPFFFLSYSLARCQNAAS